MGSLRAEAAEREPSRWTASWPVGRGPRAWLGHLGFLLGPSLLAALLLATGLLWRFDNVLYDWQLGLVERPAAADILIIAVDERSLSAIGRWPWSRRIHADLIDLLTNAGTGAIGLDVLFAEPVREDPEADMVLAQAIRANGQVVLPVLNEQMDRGGQQVETFSVPAITEAAAQLGHVDAEMDADGSVRSLFLKAGIGSPRWSHMALAILEIETGQEHSDLPGERRPRTLDAEPWVWVRDNRILIPYAGPPGHFKTLSYIDALSHEYPNDLFADKLVLIGATAAGLGDTLPTPVSALNRPMSGVEIIANVLDSLRQGIVLEPLPPSSRYALGLGLCLGLMLVLMQLPQRWLLLGNAFALVLVFTGSGLLLHWYHLWWAPTATLFSLLLGQGLWGWSRLGELTRSLTRERAHSQVVLHNIRDAVIRTDAWGQIDYLNPAAEALLGVSGARAQGSPLTSWCRIEGDETEDPVAQCLGSGQPIPLVDRPCRLATKAQPQHIRGVAAPIRSSTGAVIGALLALEESEARLEARGGIDLHTLLPNRDLFRTHLEATLIKAATQRLDVALVIIDVDHLKSVNYSCGRQCGDRLLAEVARRLRACTSEQAFLARIGGDEFALIMENWGDPPPLEAFLAGIRQTIDEPVELKEHRVVPSITAGVSIFPKDATDADSLFRNAEIAMYAAKDKTRKRTVFWTPSLGHKAIERLLRLQEVQNAINLDQLEPFFQPQVELDGERLVGFEVLVRWRHPERGLLGAAEIVPIAEQMGLAEPLAAQMLRLSCRQAKTWREAGLPPIRLGVNISPPVFSSLALVRLVREALDEFDIDPARLDLEITESAVMDDFDSSLANLRRLKGMGIHISLDDFGTGHSSLATLKLFPIDQLKLDRAFVKDLGLSPEAQAIAMAVIVMAHNLNIQVIAEGVETKAQKQLLETLDCDEIQGYYLSRPLPAIEATLWLQRSQQAAPLAGG